MNKRITVLLAALVLLLASFIPASAAAADALPAPDLTEKGSLELTMDVDGVILDSGKLHLYQVATLVPMGGVVYDFQLLDVLSAAGATLDTEDLYDGAQSERLLAAAQTAMPNGYMTTPLPTVRHALRIWMPDCIWFGRMRPVPVRATTPSIPS